MKWTIFSIWYYRNFSFVNSSTNSDEMLATPGEKNRQAE